LGLQRTRYVAATDADAAVHPYDASVGERENSWRVAVGAGSPAGPDTVARDDGPASTDVVQAVADFVDDLVEDPAEDPARDAAGDEDDT
jgi:hypothetical protein